jgi:site-specific DNA-methyltransferase (adenine-specific)
MITNKHNPDVLSCLANLSSDEVFTPPQLANEMLDHLPPEIWRDKNARFLDPFTKSGVFPREITKRLLMGLEKEFPDQQKRLNHILKNQVFGIAITDLTALISRRSVYCSKSANGKYSVCDAFTDKDGNIRFKEGKHTWEKGRCKFCGAGEEAYDRGDELESHAYEFIHTEKPEELFNMKFDVVIGNPPYQLSDGGGTGKSAIPIYQHFVTQAKNLKPKFLTMIIPARWYAGGKGLDEFRAQMLNDDQIRKLVDFETASSIFPGVDIAGGVCYFLWERDTHGPCEVTNNTDQDKHVSVRSLNEFETFIRNSQSIPIIRKVHKKQINDGARLSSRVSKRMPFGLPSTYQPKNTGIPCWFAQKNGLRYAAKSDVSDDDGYLEKWKLLIPFAPIAGQTDFSKPVAFYYDANTRIAKPGECCAETWLVACAFSTKREVESFRSYLFTKVVRFLLLQAVTSQNITRQYFYLVPDLGNYEGEYTDEKVCKLFGINEEEWKFIDSKIRTVEVENE